MKILCPALAAPLLLSLAGVVRAPTMSDGFTRWWRARSTPVSSERVPSIDGAATAVVGRNVSSVRLTPRWIVGGNPNDTTILLPLQVRATREHFLIYDGVAQHLLALSPKTGRIDWRFGRPGRGPGEFGGVAKVTSRRDGGAFIVDFALSRLTEVTEDGKDGSRVDYRMGVNPRGVCEAGDSRIHLRSTESGEIERVRLATGATSTEDLPWPELRALPSLVRQSMIFEHPQAGVCLVSVSFGPLFALLDQAGVRARSRWIEEIPMGQAKSMGKGSWRMLPSTQGALGATAVGNSFAVLFRGRGPKRGRFVDFYSVTDATYLFSIELPYAATDIAFGHGLLVLAGETEEGAPFVRAYSATPSLEELVARAIGVATPAIR